MSQAQVPSSCVESTAKSLKFSWSKPELKLDDDNSFEGYEIKYREEGERQFRLENYRQTTTSYITLRNLKSDTMYEIRILYVIDGNSTHLNTLKLKTKKSNVHTLMQMASQISVEPPIYTITPYKTVQIGTSLRECQLISEYTPLQYKDSLLKEKTILLLGETGSGKTTLIDAMFNYVADVSFKDNYRFKIVTETEAEMATTQTSSTTCYRIPKTDGFCIDFQLNIIDTPGFDGTRGQDFDKSIPNMLQNLFEKSIENLDAVCLVVPLSAYRLTAAQKYVFSCITDLFGKNIENNIFPMLTHDDGGEASCLRCLTAVGIKYQDFFRFNNYDLFLNRPSEEAWNSRARNFERFFTRLDDVQKQCLNSSRTVIATRAQLTIQLERIQEKIQIQINAINNINNEKMVLEREKMRLHESLEELDSMLLSASQWIDLLDKTALKPETRTLLSYLDEVIQIENTKKQEDYEKRIDMLKKIQSSIHNKKSLVSMISELL